MAAWRMAFRVGTGGESLWPSCKKLGVAAVTDYEIASVDLSNLKLGETPLGWSNLSSASRFTIRAFLQAVRQGDEIYVKEAEDIVGRGTVVGDYQYDRRGRLRDVNRIYWRHLRRVNWDMAFQPLDIRVGDQQRFTLRPLGEADTARLVSLQSILRERSAPSAFLVKATQRLRDVSPGWHWRNYFETAGAMTFGGRNWIRSPLSIKLIREQLVPGDLIIAYQSDDDVYGRCILGITRVTSFGRQDPPSDGAFNIFDLAPASSAFHCAAPLKVTDLEASRRPRSLAQGMQGTMFRLSRVELQGIVQRIAKMIPQQANELQAWLGDAGITANRTQSTSAARSGKPLRRSDLESTIESLERKLASRNDVFVRQEINAIIRRDGPLIQAIKKKYGYRCQFPGCRATIRTRSGLYCEVAHLKAVASGGQSTRVNLVVVCPNHHKELDHGDTQILVANRSVIRGTVNGRSFTIKR